MHLIVGMTHMLLVQYIKSYACELQKSIILWQTQPFCMAQIRLRAISKHQWRMVPISLLIMLNVKILCSMITSCFLFDRQLNGVWAQCKALLAGCVSLWQSIIVIYRVTFLRVHHSCSTFMHIQLATTKSEQYICQFGRKVNRRSCGQHLKVFCFQSNVEMIKSVGSILLLWSNSGHMFFVLTFCFNSI